MVFQIILINFYIDMSKKCEVLGWNLREKNFKKQLVYKEKHLG